MARQPKPPPSRHTATCHAKPPATLKPLANSTRHGIASHVDCAQAGAALRAAAYDFAAAVERLLTPQAQIAADAKMASDLEAQAEQEQQEATRKRTHEEEEQTLLFLSQEETAHSRRRCLS